MPWLPAAARQSFFDQYASGRIVSRVSSIRRIANVITLTIDLLSQLVLVSVIAAVMLAVNWRLALLTMASGLIVLAVALVFRSIAAGDAPIAARRPRSTLIIQETISVAVAKSSAGGGDLRHSRRPTTWPTVSSRCAAVFGSIYPLMNTLSGDGMVIVVYFGGLLVLDNTVSIGDWYLFVQA
jgi:ABC-type bacteriocin/lantibiotic exporter with double-glycine peptidase domain